MPVITTGAQLEDDDATSKHVVIVLINGSALIGGPGGIISVDTTVETLYVETREVPKRVAVGIDWQAMRNYFVNFKVVQVSVRMGLHVEANGGDVCA